MSLVTKFKKLIAKVVQFDINYVPTGTEPIGSLHWNSTDETLDLVRNDTTLQIGQELYIRVRNTSGATILNGSIVYASGHTGIYPDIDLARADAETTGRVIGVATENIPNNNFGAVTTFGYVRGLKTNYSGSGIWGITWAEGDILYLSKTDAGVLTNVEPSSPHYSDMIGVVGVVHPTQGTILVNPNRHTRLGELSDVNGTALSTSGQFLVWDNVNQYFDFTENINNYTPYSGATNNLNLGSFGISASSLTLSGATASTIASFDGSKNLVSLATSTYPSLTELSYVKGVTSAIQTQFSAKLNAANPVFTGQMTGALGSVGVPSYSFTGDGNTGMWSPAADTLAWSTNGTEKIRVNGSGDVGIGASSPLAKLSVVKNSASFTPITIGTNSDFVANFADNINDASGVQMGNTNTGTAADFRFLIKDPTNHYFAFSQPSINSNLTLFGLNRKTTDFIFNAGGTSRDICIGTGAATNLVFGTNLAERVRVESGGNVGIGTNSPSARLHAISTTEQLRIGYDTSNYWNAATSSTGATTFNAVGSGAAFLFSDKVTVTNNDIEATGSANGIILTSPNGTRWRVQINNTGALTTTAI